MLQTSVRKIFIAVAFLVLMLPVVAMAAPTGDPYGLKGAADNVPGVLPVSDPNSVTSSFIAGTLGRLVAPFLQFIALVLFGFIIYAGYLWLTAGGNEEQTTKAKQIIANAVIGIAIVLFAYFITTFVTAQITASVVAK